MSKSQATCPSNIAGTSLPRFAMEKKKKRLNSDQPPSIPFPHVSEDDIGVDLDEPTSPPKSSTTSKPLSFLYSLFQAPSAYVESSSMTLDSPAYFQSNLEGPRNCVSLVNYDDEQEGEKQFQLQNLTNSSAVQDNQDEDTTIQTVHIPSSEGLIFDDELNDM
ncbi:unnamed protein product [Lactuca saligna]|uniref:Uncharacterized protein n=1 Tax=Lactuca saligna TaxID=75948 RepID=A0AA35YQL9_LACSI|nr:unnamed protein product [Lactuca saligna]